MEEEHQIEQYVILDDELIGEEFQGHQVYLDLYRGYTPEQKYKLQEYIDLSLLKEKRKKLSKEEQQLYLKNLYCNQIMKHINDLKLQLEKLREKQKNNEIDETR